MLQSEILVGKRLGAINANRSRPISVQKISTLKHKVFDHAVKLAAFVSLRPAVWPFGLTRAELTEIFGGFGSLGLEELHFDSAERFAADGDVEEDDRVGPAF